MNIMRDRTDADPSGRLTDAPSPVTADQIRQFVIFKIAEGSFAVPMAEVNEIVRMPELARVPLCSSSLVGLVNLRGTVQPVLSTRRLFGLADHPHDAATRVVILQCGGPVGIVVDRMAKVVSVNASQIDPVGDMQTMVRSDLLCGVIKGLEDHDMVMILDVARMITADMPARAAKAGTGGAPRPGPAPARAETAPAAAGQDEMQMVCFEVDGQEYGFEIHAVQEIVETPASFAEVPRADSAVMGMMTLRDKLLPVFGLRQLFGLAPAAAQDQNRVAVLNLPQSNLCVGVVMDRVREVLRVSRDLIDPVPPLFETQGPMHDITAVCRLNGGKRMICLLSPDRMFSGAGGAVRLDLVHSAGADAMTTPTTGRASEEQFVVFRLMDEEYGTPIASVQEIVRVPPTIAKVPKSPDFIDGIMNLRGTVIPIVDQRRRFGLPASEPNDRQRIVVLSIRGMLTGFIVDSVSEVMRVSSAAIEPAPALSEEQARIIRRVANLPDRHRMVLILDADEMLNGAEIALLDAA